MKNENDLFSKNNLSRLAKDLPYIKFPEFNIKTINGVASIAKILSKQNLTITKASTDFGKQFQDKNYQNLLSVSSSTFTSFNQSLKRLAKINSPLSKQLSEIGKNQLVLSNNLIHIQKSLDSLHLNKFNGIGFALEGISNDYLKKHYQNKKLE